VKLKLKITIAGLFILGTGIVFFAFFGRSIWVPIQKDMSGKQTVDDVIREVGPRVDLVMSPVFENAGLRYPSQKVALLAFKEEKRLELWAKNDGEWSFVKDFPVLAASGSAGPKLREGDRQVPEGIYGVEYLNPNSSYHLSIKLDYPNEFDREQAKIDGRTSLGGDIFIHGNSLSVGCLAMGDDVAEQLFVLVAKVGKDNVRVIVAPRDFRRTGLSISTNPKPAWLPTLYQNIETELRAFPIPN